MPARDVQAEPGARRAERSPTRRNARRSSRGPRRGSRQPASRTANRVRPPCRFTDTTIREPSGEYFRALSSRFVSTRTIRRGRRAPGRRSAARRGAGRGSPTPLRVGDQAGADRRARAASRSTPSSIRDAVSRSSTSRESRSAWRTRRRSARPGRRRRARRRASFRVPSTPMIAASGVRKLVRRDRRRTRTASGRRSRRRCDLGALVAELAGARIGERLELARSCRCSARWHATGRRRRTGREHHLGRRSAAPDGPASRRPRA